jgi:3-oxoadipate enol-lactonase
MAVDVHHELSGPAGGPPVVLSSSLGTNLEMWDAQVGPLSGRHRVVRYDMRGHGRSPVPPGPYAIDDMGGDALALLDRLGLERVSWVGVSMGGMIGMWLAINAPERIDRLVLCCTSARMDPAGWADRIAAIRAGGGVAAIADAVIARWLTQEWREAHPAQTAALRDALAAQPIDGYVACCEAIAAMDLRPGLPSIAADTLVIAGRHDVATPPEEHSRPIADAIPAARYRVVEGAHLAPIDAADAVTQLIIEHLGGGPA